VATVDAEAVVVRRELVGAAGGDPQYRLALFFTNMDDRSSDLLTDYLATLE
jgi:hypothetical protein